MYLIITLNMKIIHQAIMEECVRTNKLYDKIAIITQIQQRTKFYLMCTSNPWYLIMILIINMKKIHPSVIEECLRMVRLMD